MENKKLLKNLINKILEFKDYDDAKDFLHGILTVKELEEIPMRLEIVKLLKKGVPQHVIAKKLGIGVETVTRGLKELKLGRFKTI